MTKSYRLLIVTSNDDQVKEFREKYGIEILLRNGSQIKTDFEADLTAEQAKELISNESVMRISLA